MPGTNVEHAKRMMAEAYKHGAVPQDTKVFYDQWAQDDAYDKHLNKDLYKGPELGAKLLANYFSQAKRPNVRILDIAAGTGFVAEYLRAHGFDNIDALDPSEGMMKKAQMKGLYKHYMVAYVDDKPLPTLEDTYDGAVCSGGMGEGHIPYYGLDQIIRVVKPGGLICLVMREEYLKHSQYEGKLEPHMDKLEREGKWQLLDRTVVPEYCGDKNGLVYQYKVL